MLFDHRRQNEDDHRWHWLNGFGFALHCHYTDCKRITRILNPDGNFQLEKSLFSFLFFSVLMQNKNDHRLSGLIVEVLQRMRNA